MQSHNRRRASSIIITCMVFSGSKLSLLELSISTPTSYKALSYTWGPKQPFNRRRDTRRRGWPFYLNWLHRVLCPSWTALPWSVKYPINRSHLQRPEKLLRIKRVSQYDKWNLLVWSKCYGLDWWGRVESIDISFQSLIPFGPIKASPSMESLIMVNIDVDTRPKWSFIIQESLVGRDCGFCKNVEDCRVQ